MLNKRRKERTMMTASCTARTFTIAIATLAASSGTTRADTNYCAQTARTLYSACKAGATEDSLVQKAICLNVSDADERETCISDQAESRKDDESLCRDQRDTRLESCDLLGPDRYDPNLDPDRFDDPRHPTRPNPYFPLTVGNQWEYRGGGELNTVEVVPETKRIAGVTCAVFRDLVFSDGELTESTDDWFASAKDGTVWYFGEETGEYESFEGDHPEHPELVDIEGSFKTGRDGAKPGIIFLASPHPGDVYLEEFSLANAEDATEILSTNYSYGKDATLDQSVPKPLAQKMCANADCVVTRNFSMLEPGIFARKYYARGIGVFLEVEFDPEESEPTVNQLTHCNFDARCTGLPQP
jgi:hypothetical protein